MLIALDRLLKFTLLHYAQAELGRVVERAYRHHVLGYEGARLEPLGFSRPGIDGVTLFSSYELAAPPPDDAQLAEAACKLGAWSRAIAARGSRLVFMPVPAKSSVLHALVPLPGPDLALDRLAKHLRREGVDYVNLWPAYRDANALAVPLYEPDDNHWGPRGIALATDVLVAHLRSRKDTLHSR
jgi:hypothetical protein